jgi:hypothetical protein
MTGQSLGELSPPPSKSVAADANEQHKADLLEQFYLTLQVTYLAAPQVPGSVVHERIERLFNGVHSWRNAYEIEQLLCFVISDQQLETELNRRLAEAQTLKLEHVAVIDKELHPDTKPPADKRIVLHRLLNDLQWFYSKRVHHRAASKRLMVRVSLLFMVALATFSLVLFIQFFAHGPATAPAGAAAPNAVANEGAQGQANTAGGAGSGSVANQAAQGQANTSPGAGSAATTNQSAQGQPNTTGGAK